MACDGTAGEPEGVRARSNATGLAMDMTRPAYTQSGFDESHKRVQRPSKSVQDMLRSWRRKHACSRHCMTKLLLSLIPFIGHMRTYNLKRHLFKDFIAGLTVGIMHIPQGMAYGLLANLPPVYGLYTSFFPVLIYCFFGTSKHISIGTFAVISLMVGTAVDKSSCSDFASAASESSSTGNFSFMVDNYTGSLSSTASSDIDISREEIMCKIGMATAVTLMTGVIQLLMGIMRLGFAAVYLSDPLTSGLTTAAAMHVLTSQVKHMLGISIARYSGPLKLVYMYAAMFSRIHQTNLIVLLMSIITIIIILVTKEYINPKVKPKLHMPLPIELILVIVATLISTFGKFDSWLNVDVVGPVPTGIPPPSVPPSDKYIMVLQDAVGMAIVAFAVNVSLAKMFAKKHNYTINSNQELIAYGTTNIFSSFFNCFTSAASLSRSLVQDAADCQSQVTGLVSCGLLIIVLFAVGPLFQKLPKSILAAIIVGNLKGMFRQFQDLKKLWYISKCDFLIWLVVFLAVIFLDVDLGLLVGFVFCLLTVVFRTQKPYTCLLGRVPNTDIYKDVNVYNAVEEIAGIKIFRFESSLYYANAEYFQDRLSKKTGVNVSLLKSKHSAARQLEPAAPPTATSQPEETEALNTEAGSQSVSTLPGIRYIVVDCTTMGYIDWTGVSMFGKLIQEFKDAGITVFLAGCKAGVRRMLDNAGFFKKIDKNHLFLSVHDAVVTAQYRERTSANQTEGENAGGAIELTERRPTAVEEGPTAVEEGHPAASPPAKGSLAQIVVDINNETDIPNHTSEV